MAVNDLCAVEIPPAPGGFWSNLFATDFVPRAQCVGERPEIILLHVVSDVAIAVAYFSIPIALVVFLRKRRDIAFRWVFWLFAAFILACGATHVFGAVAFWAPMYRADGVVKALTAGISLLTAALLWPLIPKALALPSQQQLHEANRALQEEIAVRREAEAKLDAARQQLEQNVQVRTAELNSVNTSLEAARRTAERKLAEIEALYASAPAGLCFLDVSSRFIRVNTTFAALFNAHPAAFLERPLADLKPLLGPELHDAIFRAETAGETIASLGLVLAAGPDPKHAVASIRPARSHAGDLMGVSVVIQDSTERDLLEDQLRQSQKSEAIGQLASGIAHEINNALTAVYGYLSLGRACITDNHAAAGYLDQILVAAQQASSVTKSLLTFARRERSKREPVDLHDAILRAVSLLHGLMPANIHISLDADAAAGAVVLGDANQLQQVILNLAINSRDAMPRGGEISIRATSLPGDPPRIRLSVSDTGSGMSPEVQQRAFEPFFTTKPRGRGTGLGLSVVHGIVTSHEGEIRIRSAPGEGAVIEIDLPLARPEAPRRISDADSDPGPVRGTVILAEDNRTIRHMFATVMRQKGLSVVEAADGVEFMDHVAGLATVGSPVLAVVLDIDMPGRSGLECLKLLRQRGDLTPVVLISGGPIDAMDDPRVLILPKPFTSADLIQAIGRVIRQFEP